jgi:hypothetical protein
MVTLISLQVFTEESKLLLDTLNLRSSVTVGDLV